MLVKLIHDLLSCDPQFEKYYPRNSKRWSDGKQKGKERERWGGGIWERTAKWTCARETEKNRKWLLDFFFFKEMFIAGYRNKILVIWGIIKFSSIWALRKCHMYDSMSGFFVVFISLASYLLAVQLSRSLCSFLRSPQWQGTPYAAAESNYFTMSQLLPNQSGLCYFQAGNGKNNLVKSYYL